MPDNPFQELTNEELISLWEGAVQLQMDKEFIDSIVDELVSRIKALVP